MSNIIENSAVWDTSDILLASFHLRLMSFVFPIMGNIYFIALSTRTKNTEINEINLKMKCNRIRK